MDLLNDSYNFWDLSSLSDRNQKISVYKQHSETYNIINGILIVAMLAVVAAVLSPNPLDKELPVGLYRYSGSYYLYLSYYFAQQSTIVCAWITVPTLEIIYIGACTMVAAQFRIAGNYLKNIKHDGGQNLVDVKIFVEYHNKLFRFSLILKAASQITISAILGRWIR